MRVCYISGEYPPMEGGIGDYLAGLRTALSGLGVETSVITSRAAARARLSDETVYPAIARWGFASWPTIERLLRQVKAEVAHIQYQSAAFDLSPAINLLPSWLRRRMSGCRVVTTFHDLRVPYIFPKAGRLRPLAVRALLRSSHAAIMTNEEDLAIVSAEAGDAGPLLRLIPLASSLPPRLADGFDRDRCREVYGASSDDLLLCYFGLLNARKGIDILLQALADLRAQDAHIRLLMIGAGIGDADPTNASYRELVMAQVDGLGLAGAISWTGFLSPEDASAAFASADICILPFLDGASYRRSSLIAALGHGLPVITTNPASSASNHELPELVSGHNCLLVPPGDPEALVSAINTLADSLQLRLELGSAARTIAETFSWPRVAGQTVELYEKALGKPIV